PRRSSGKRSTERRPKPPAVPTTKTAEESNRGHTVRRRTGGNSGVRAETTMTPEFLLTTLIVVATPGAGVLYTLAAGVSRGWQASLVAAFACTLGIVPHMIAAVTGLAAIMHASAVAFSIIKWLGVAYLLYLAWKTFRDKSIFAIDTEPVKPSPWRVIVSGILVNTLNPKLTIFFFAFLPQFVPADRADAVP